MVEPNEPTRLRGGPNPSVIWLTGISGAGKTTLARLLEKALVDRGRRCYVLDGDDMRRGISADLGYTDEDRRENIRRAREICFLLVDAGLVVIASFISPFRADRQLVRDRFEAGQFIEVFVDTPLSVAEARDVKGLYRKARNGSLSGFTGITSPYEAPLDPDLHLRTAGRTEAESLEEILAQLARAGLLD